MTGKRYSIVLLLGLIFLLQSCGGNDASFDAIVVGPEDPGACDFAGTPGATTPTFFCTTVNALQFKVQKSADDPTPVANANVRIDAGGVNTSGVFLLDPNDITNTTCLDGSSISSPGPGCFSFFTKTNNLGAVPLFRARANIPNCGSSTGDIKATSSATVTISASFATVTQDITVTCS